MRILIVEDELRLSEALTQILKKNKYLVDAVYDGETGLDYALADIYDVVILDIMLPKLNGIEILKKIRKAKLSVPVLLLTAKDEIEDKVTGLDSGADDYLTKPFATEELLARLRVLLRRKGEIIDEEIQFVDLSLNLSTSELFCGKKSVKLGLKEQKIMKLLLLNGRQIILKETLIEKIWGFDSEAEDNNLEVYVSFLRKKTAYLNSRVKIKTTRGLGYSLEAEND